MHPQKSTACGIDIHKDFFVAAIVNRDGSATIQKFDHTQDGLLALKSWVLSAQCSVVGMESTGNYWRPLHLTLDGYVELILANAYVIKRIPGRKTDTLDAQWIAELALNGLLTSSRVFPKDAREIRELTRARERLVDQCTKCKRIVHDVFDAACIKLSSIITDIFGKSGRYLIQGLLKEKTVDELIAGIPSKRIRKKESELKNAIKSGLSASQVIVIEQNLQLIDRITEQIAQLDEEILFRMKAQEEDLQIAMSMPGIGTIAAVTILAELGDYRDFNSPDSLASWAGMVPSVYQSADKLRTGSITKRGSKHLRRILVEAAQAAARTKNTRFSAYFRKLKNRIGYQKAIVALARKILCILWHLLMNREFYRDALNSRPKSHNLIQKPVTPQSIERSIEILVKAGYCIQKSNTSTNLQRFQGAADPP
jgi:transposase